MKKYVIIAAAALALTACSSDDNLTDGEPVAAQIRATIGNRATSRAIDTEWAKDDAIGIYMGDARYINYKYVTAEADGVFSGTVMYFQNKREPVTLTAYYPFTGSEGEDPVKITAVTTIDKQNADDQATYDFLYARMENVVGGDNPNVNFSFSHKMSKLSFVFNNGNETYNGGADVSKIKSVVISGLRLNGSFDTRTGVCSATGDTEPMTIELAEGTITSGEPLSPLILFPQEITEVRMRITDSDDQYYECTLDFPGNALKSGENYKFTITVKKTQMNVSSEIVDWHSVDLTGGAVSTD